MSHALTVAVSDQVWHALQRQATSTGTPPDQLAANVLAEHFVPNQNGRPARKRKEDMTQEEKEAAMRRLQQHFGAADLGYATGLDNESIDADLAREYGSTHEPDECS